MQLYTMRCTEKEEYRTIAIQKCMLTEFKTQRCFIPLLGDACVNSCGCQFLNNTLHLIHDASEVNYSRFVLELLLNSFGKKRLDGSSDAN